MLHSTMSVGGDFDVCEEVLAKFVMHSHPALPQLTHTATSLYMTKQSPSDVTSIDYSQKASIQSQSKEIN